MLISLCNCGTILKSYQINKPHSNNFDGTIVILDSLGLLLLIFPGMIALFVDYTNGTIYLPE